MQYKICAIFFRWQRCKFHVFFIGHKGPSKRANLGWSPRGCRQFVWHLSIPAVFFDGMGSCNINFTVCQCCLGHRRLNFMKPGSCFLICVGKPKRYIYIYIYVIYVTLIPNNTIGNVIELSQKMVSRNLEMCQALVWASTVLNYIRVSIVTMRLRIFERKTRNLTRILLLTACHTHWT